MSLIVPVPHLVLHLLARRQEGRHQVRGYVLRELVLKKYDLTDPINIGSHEDHHECHECHLRVPLAWLAVLADQDDGREEVENVAENCQAHVNLHQELEFLIMVVKQFFNIDFYSLVDGIEAEPAIAVLELGIIVIWIVLLIKCQRFYYLMRFWQLEPNTDANDASDHMWQKHPNNAHAWYLK